MTETPAPDDVSSATTAPASGRRPRALILTAGVLVGALCLAAGSAAAAGPVEKTSGSRTSKTSTATPSTSTTTTTTAGWMYKQLRAPDRVQVLDGSTQPLATFTVGARTVTLRGAARTFAEPTTTSAAVVSRTWVRLLPKPFTGAVDTAWLSSALADTSPDVLGVAAQYVTGAATVRSTDGSVLSSDAEYGPLQADGTREEGSDFNDYLGLSWDYGSQSDAPEARQIGALDCSGFIRMVLGRRAGLPLTLDPNAGLGLPRRSFEMLDSAPGVVTVPNTGARPASTTALAPGDLVFFDGSADDGTRIDHVGLYLGPDTAGAPRFVSSRKTINGPTLGDAGGRSTLSGSGYYANAWRGARRL